MHEGRFYDQSRLWGRRPEPYQVQVRADVLQILPPDVRSVLDVGCGDGFITNALPGRLRVVGLDISPQALAHLRRPAVVGSVLELPFADRSFDLVMVNDVLEHLPDEAYARARRELVRVADRYVLVTVPHAEQLEANVACCADCGERYHVNWHQRAFTADAMTGLLEAPFHPVEIRLTGDQTRPPPDPTVGLRHEMSIFRVWAGGVCPRCGSKRQMGYEEQSPALQAMDVCRAERWCAETEAGAAWNNRTEIMGLYARGTCTVRRSPAPVSCGTASLLEIDFADRPQVQSGDFVPGAHWARWTLPEGAVAGAGGVRRSGDAPDPLPVHARIPAVGRTGDRIVVELAPEGEGELRLCAVDGLSGVESLLLTCRPGGEPARAMAILDAPLRPDRFGLALTLYLRGEITVRRLAYEPAGRPEPRSAFVALQAGHNLLSWEHEGIVWSWGLDARSDGRYPMPLPACQLDRPGAAAAPCDAAAILALLDEQVAGLRRRLAGLHEILEQREQSREIAEQAHVRLEARCTDLDRRVNELLALVEQKDKLANDQQARCRELSEHLEDTESRREAAEQAYARLEIRCRELSEHLEDTESRREAAERAYAALQQEHNTALREWGIRTGFKGGLREILQTARHRIVGPPLPVPQPVFPDPWRPFQAPVPTGRRRVLILSHMFPHPDQPSSGPFVHEQALALARHADVDVRVLVGRPFWMTTRRPVLLARMEAVYRRFHDRCGWVEYKGVPVKYVPYRVFGPFLTHGWSYRAAMCRGIERLHEEFPFELVHAHTAYTDGSAGLAIARRFDVPLVITEHTGPFTILTRNPVVRFWALRAMNGASRILGVSRAQCDAVGQYLNPRLRGRLEVMPNVVDVELFHRPAAWNPDPQAPRILFAGYFVPIKRLEHLLEAFARLSVEIPAARLRLVGGGENPGQEEDLRGQIAARGLGDRVEVFGYQPREALAYMMREWADMLVLSSQAETFGCVLIEALACGKPVVSTRCGGPEDIITADFLGRLADNQDPADLARAMGEVAGNLAAFEPARIRRHAVETFGFAAVARRIAALYDEILGGP